MTRHALAPARTTLPPAEAGLTGTPRLADFAALARPKLALLSLIAVLLAYRIAGPTTVDAWVFGHLLVGGLLALCGGSVLNQLLERDVDGLMKRTMQRPLPAGRVSPVVAAAFAAVLVFVGVIELYLGVNALTAAMAVAGLVTYAAVYTPLKRRTSLSTVIGAAPGAVPALMGWSAARGQLDVGAWTLFGILFLWQLPHFLAIAWMYRRDYADAGFRMLPIEDPAGASTVRQIVVYCLALVAVSTLPAVYGWVGPWYLAGAAGLGVCYLGAGMLLHRDRTGIAAKRLLKMSVVYLPLLLGLMALDSRWP